MPDPIHQRRFSKRRRTALALAAVLLIGLAVSQTAALARRAATAAATGGHGVVSVLELERAGRPSDVWVYRPAVADSAALPVVYFLSGLPGAPSDLFRAGLAAALDRYVAAGGTPFAVAAPDGNSTGHADTEWADASDGSDSLETFVTTTVIAAVEGAHPRTAARRSIAGFSMGGYGAVNIAERHPGLFGQVVSIAGYFKLDDPSRMFATAASRAANTPTRNAGQLAGERILLLEDAQESEALIKGQARAFKRVLAAAGIPATQVTAAGAHDWSYVAGQLPRIERFLAAAWMKS